MNIKRTLYTILLALGLSSSALYAIDNHFVFGIVNFSSCINESKYGKNEQEQIENIKKQYVTLIENAEKELKDVSAKFEDQEYLDGLSPEAEEDLRLKQKTLSEDLYKFQNQLYQVMNQANYFLYQKMLMNVSKASEKIASDKNLDFVMNKEACFYNKPGMDVTDLVIKEMDKNFDEDANKNKVSANQEGTNQLAEKLPNAAAKDDIKNEEVKELPQSANAEKVKESVEVKK